MHFLTLICISVVLPVIKAGSLPNTSSETVKGASPGRHIVMLKPGVVQAAVLGQVASISATETGSGITHHWTSAVNGFAGTFDKDTLAALQAMPGVASIVEDGIVNATSIPGSAPPAGDGTVNATATMSNQPWGLARLSSNKRLGCSDTQLIHTYNYDPRAGQGVDIYVLDTGIRITHEDFGGRARWGATFGPYESRDGNGHGTHCAGTAVGTRYGVAKRANVYAVKVLSDQGSGRIVDVIAGMDYVLRVAKASGRPTVVSMSIGGSPNAAVDQATRALVANGLHVVVGAGSSNVDAINQSPGRVAEAITVGSSNILDERASWSNWGSIVDIFAPGVNVASAWVDNDTSTRILSGTAMSTPHVAGLIAYLISIQGNTTPALMSQRLKEMALKAILNPYSLPAGTANLVIHNQYVAV